SDASQRDLRALGVTAPILVVPHATHDLFMTQDLTKEEAREKLGLAKDKVIYLQFGHIDTRKGCLEFVEVARRCVDVASVHFVMAGKNDLSRSDNALLDAQRDLPNLTLVEGFVPLEEVQLYFIACDVVAAPYREGTTSGVYRL